MKYLFLAFSLVSGFSQAGAPSTNSEHEQGRELYNYRCYYCHGYSGNAKTLATQWMEPKPADFTQMTLADHPEEHMLEVVAKGVDGTAMASFSYFLNADEMKLVVNFIRQEFMQDKKVNTIYHTAEAGWPDHQKYSAAFPYARGEIAIDSDDHHLTAEQRQGKQLFLNSCITCHDHGKVNDLGPIWRSQTVSYPRNNYSFTDFDGTTGASVYLQHDTPEPVDLVGDSARLGKQLWDDNCAFCHAKDGTGHNWIGSFLEYKPRDLTDPQYMQYQTRESLMLQINNGVVNTSMPAWKSVLTEEQINAIIEYVNQAFHPVKDS